MTPEQIEKHKKKLLIFKTVLNQQRTTKNKIYSLHEPQTICIAKGKEAKKYEFGNKVSIVKTKKSGIIIGALSFKDNIYDGNTLEPQLKQIKRLIGVLPKVGIADRGYKGRKKVFDTEIIIPGKLPASANNYQKQKIRKYFRARAGIEPIIGHIKHDHRMIRNYLSGELGDMINVMFAVSGFNMKKMLQRLKAEASNFCTWFYFKIFHANNQKLFCIGNFGV